MWRYLLVDPIRPLMSCSSGFFEVKLAVKFALSLLFPVALWGVYAPIPEQDQGYLFMVALEGGAGFDSNIFGAPANELDSFLITFSPQLKLNYSVEDQTFLSAVYDLDANFYTDRPSNDSLLNHMLGLSLSHTFSPTLYLDLEDTFLIIDSPESFEIRTLQTDQSFHANSIYANLRAEMTQNFSASLKFRHQFFSYDNTVLASLLDRGESEFGVEGRYKMLPELSLLAEYRFQNVGYDDNSVTVKDSDSNFFLFGAEYLPDEKLSLTAVGGIEDRDRDGAPDGSFGFAEVFAIYRYLPDSFVSGGINFGAQETDNVGAYLDEENLGIFANIQHAVTHSIFASGSGFYESSDLNARPGPARAQWISVKIPCEPVWV